MYKKLLFLSLILIVLLTPITESTAATTDSESKGNFLITFSEDVNQDLITRHGGTIENFYPSIGVVKANLPVGKIDELSKKTEIKRIDKDSKIYSNYYEPLPEGIHQKTNWGFKDSKIKQIHNKLNLTGKDVSIAILDSGIDLDHEDLTVKDGKSFVSYTSSYNDDAGHGTHVSGIIGAKDNDVGVIGISPDADLYSGKVLNYRKAGYVSDLTEGILWAIKKDVDIISMSISTDNNTEALKSAIDLAHESGIILVASSGNSDSLKYPALYDTVISVGAVDEKSNVADFSARGENLDFVAPGVNVLSTFYDGGYIAKDGTSMAAPYVTGYVALLLQKYPSKTPDEILNSLKGSTIPYEDPLAYGYGIIDPVDLLY